MARIALVALVGLGVLIPDVGVAEPTADVPVADAPTKTEKKKKKKKKKGPKIGGFLQAFYRHTFFTSTDGAVDAPNFRIQRVRIDIEGKINRYLRYDVSVDPRAPEVTGFLRDAYITVKHVIPHHKIRIGQQKTQFGYENNVSSSKLFVVNRTEVSDNLSRGPNLRDIGIGVLGGWPITDGLVLEDAVTVVNGNGFNTQEDDTHAKSYWGRVGARYDRACVTLRFGMSAAKGDFIEPPDPDIPGSRPVHIKFDRLGGDVEVDSRWVAVSAEYVWGRDETFADTDDVAGYYVTLVGKSPYQVGPMFRYDVLGDEFQRFTFGGYYGDPKARFRVLLNYEYRRLKDSVRGDDRLFVWTQVRF